MKTGHNYIESKHNYSRSQCVQYGLQKLTTKQKLSQSHNIVIVVFICLGIDLTMFPPYTECQYLIFILLSIAPIGYYMARECQEVIFILLSIDLVMFLPYAECQGVILELIR